MLLSDGDIEKAVKSGELTIKPFDKKRLQPASYDILLGNRFIINNANATHSIDPARKKYADTREIFVGDGKEFVLHPGVSVLSVAKDFMGSDKYLIQLGGKSSLARVGLLDLLDRSLAKGASAIKENEVLFHGITTVGWFFLI